MLVAPGGAQVLGAHPAVDGVLEAAVGGDALVLRPLVGLAVVEAVVEEQCGVGLRRHRDVEPRESCLASAALDAVQVDQKGEVAVTVEPGLTRVVVVVVRLVVLARAVFDRLQRLEVVLRVACEVGLGLGLGIEVRGWG